MCVGEKLFQIFLSENETWSFVQYLHAFDINDNKSYIVENLQQT